MKNLNKIKSYYGLSIRARKVAIGTNEILEKESHVVLISKALSENSINKIKNHYSGRKTKIEILSEDKMFAVTENSKILAFGVTDSGLANAIINNL